VNDHPSLNINLCTEGAKGQGLIKELSEVDKFIKVKVIGDAIKLMKKKSYKDKRSEIEGYKCWKRILPSEDCDDLDAFVNGKKIFDKLVSKKGTNMSMTAFCRLHKLKCVSDNIQKVSLEIQYKRILQRANIGFLDLETFFALLEDLAN